jgi:hypothetical protein
VAGLCLGTGCAVMDRMTRWATRAVFTVAMLAPIAVGLWLYSFVFASPIGMFRAAPSAVTPTATRTNGDDAPTTSGAQLPQPTTSPTAFVRHPYKAAEQSPTLLPIAIPVAPAATETPAPRAPATPTINPALPSSAATAAPRSSGGQLMLNPVQTVEEFYRRISNHEFDAAAELWTPDMRRRFPPAGNINQRFDQTRSIRVESARLIDSSSASGQATVAVELLETRGTPSASQRLSGTWTLVRVESGWLLERPAF